MWLAVPLPLALIAPVPVSLTFSMPANAASDRSMVIVAWTVSPASAPVSLILSVALSMT